MFWFVANKCAYLVFALHYRRERAEALSNNAFLKLLRYTASSVLVVLCIMGQRHENNSNKMSLQVKYLIADEHIPTMLETTYGNKMKESSCERCTFQLHASPTVKATGCHRCTAAYLVVVHNERQLVQWHHNLWHTLAASCCLSGMQGLPGQF